LENAFHPIIFWITHRDHKERQDKISAEVHVTKILMFCWKITLYSGNINFKQEIIRVVMKW